jgi:hypothetical protein
MLISLKRRSGAGIAQPPRNFQTISKRSREPLAAKFAATKCLRQDPDIPRRIGACPSSFRRARRTGFWRIHSRVTIGADAAITSANGLGCRYIAQSGRRNWPPAPITAHPAKAATQPPDNARKAAWLWGAREPITEGCPAGLYLRRARRFDGPIPPTLGYLPPNSKYPPAMIVAFGFCEEPEPGVIDPPANVTGVHLTRLTPDGGKAPIGPVKIMLGPSAGLPIVLAPATDLLAIDIAEGIEKGLLIQADIGAGMWVAGTAGRMPAVAAVLPAYVECVTVWADRDEAGLKFAQEAARIIQARKIEVRTKGIPNG